MARVTIILTSFNHENYIGAAIDSVLVQTYQDYELIVWDDASNDDSWQIITSYSDPRIKPFRNQTRRRGVYGINKAIKEVAQGEFIAIHHSDDTWEPNKIEKQVAYLDSNQDIAAVCTRVQFIDEHNNALQNDWFNSPNKGRYHRLRELFQDKNTLCHPSALIRKDVLLQVGLYRYGLAQTADADMWIRILRNHNIGILEDMLTNHRMFSDKSNTSADSSVATNRLSSEWYILKSNYMGMTSNELFMMFPEAEKWKGTGNSNARYILAMIAIELGKTAETRTFGLNLMFTLINDPSVAEDLSNYHDYDYMDFVEQTAKYGGMFDRENTKNHANILGNLPFLGILKR